jgi:cellulose synthase/poly-beta-1,6-N-acetylglucosamine synthase-like glycosyltransferase
MTPSDTIILVSYFFVLSILAVYGWHRYFLVYLYMRHKDSQPAEPPPLDPLPVVTIQLPIYNEMYVADRLIDAVCRIDYPRELLEIQVLDDSTDETSEICELALSRFSTPISCPAPTFCTVCCRTLPIRTSAWCRRAGAISTRITRS